MIKRTISFRWVLSLALLLAVLSGGRVLTASAEVNDCSDSAADFSRAVAQINMNSSLQLRSARTFRAAAMNYVVICRTDGRELSAPEDCKAVRGPENRYVLAFSSQEAADAGLEQLLRTPGMLWAEHDTLVTAASDGQTSGFTSYGLENMQVAPLLALAEDFGIGDVTVAVVDSGVVDHALLTDRISEYGYDYVDMDNDPTDLFGHGTHVAGIIAECTAGTDAWLYPIRVLNNQGKGSLSNLIAGVVEAKNRSADVINLSLVAKTDSAALADTIRSAVDAGIVVVCAAGNGGVDTANLSPANVVLDGLMVVGAAEVNGLQLQRTSYSNYGSSIDLYAYGTGIQSCSLSGGYTSMTGTSMAAAHISGISALMRLLWPDLSPAEVENRLKAVAPGQINIPLANGLVPDSMGASSGRLTLSVGDRIPLWLQAEPATACAPVLWQVPEDGVVSLDEDGFLLAEKVGTTTLTADCRGLPPVTLEIHVQAVPGPLLRLPEDTRKIEEEAFAGSDGARALLPDGLIRIDSRAFAQCDDLGAVYIPDSVLEYGENLFADSDQTRILCSYSSVAYYYAKVNQIPYLLLKPELTEQTVSELFGSEE